jgi:hypothetical protein
MDTGTQGTDRARRRSANHRPRIHPPQHHHGWSLFTVMFFCLFHPTRLFTTAKTTPSSSLALGQRRSISQPACLFFFSLSVCCPGSLPSYGWHGSGGKSEPCLLTPPASCRPRSNAPHWLTRYSATRVPVCACACACACRLWPVLEPGGFHGVDQSWPPPPLESAPANRTSFVPSSHPIPRSRLL